MEINLKNEELFWGMNEKTFLIILHLSQFAGFIFPYVGFVLPLAMWLTNKDKNVLIDEHGKNIINWLITATLFAIGAGVLTLVLVGFPLLVIIAILAILYPILGAIKASDKQFWKYPLTINFFSS